eukprot:8632-Heterococcus_DN1.PRE.2
MPSCFANYSSEPLLARRRKWRTVINLYTLKRHSRAQESPAEAITKPTPPSCFKHWLPKSDVDSGSESCVMLQCSFLFLLVITRRKMRKLSS